MSKINPTQTITQEIENNCKEAERKHEENNIILLHAAIAAIYTTLDSCINLNLIEEPEDKKKISESYQLLNAHHTHNSYASLGVTATGIAQVATLAYGMDKSLTEAIGTLTQSGVGAFKDYNLGKIQAFDTHLIEQSKKEAEKKLENSRHLQNLQERSKELANSAINRAIEAYQIRV